MYDIFETQNYLASFNKIDKSFQRKLISKIHQYIYPQLEKEPHFGINIKKLKNYSPETWRYRINNYRLFYEIDDLNNIVYITLLKSRQSTY